MNCSSVGVPPHEKRINVRVRVCDCARALEFDEKSRVKQSCGSDPEKCCGERPDVADTGGDPSF